MPALYTLTEEYAALIAEIEAAGGEMSEDLLARFQAIEGKWDHKLAACAAMADHLRLMGSAFADIVKRKQALARAYGNSADRLKEYIQGNMEAMNCSKVEDAELGIRVRLCNSPARVEVQDESKVPEAYLVPQPPKLATTEIAKALKAGAEVAGCVLVQGKHIRIE